MRSEIIQTGEKKMKKQFLIRYNTDSKDDHDRWRLIDGEHEYLVSEIQINVISKTSKNEMKDVGIKYHIICEGILEITEGIAYIR